MKQNVGKIDKIIRVGIVVLVSVLYYNKILTGTIGIILLLASIVVALAGIIGFCPLYAIFKINTCKKN